jgi:non-ribosomal peptide synthetase component F
MVVGAQSDIALTRLQQTQNHIAPEAPHRDVERLSIVHGPTTSPLWELTLSELLELQCLRHRDSECLVVPWTTTRWTYGQLQEESERLSRGLIARGVQHGDRIGIMAGNCEQYASLFFAAAAVGAILVVINNTYTKAELLYALEHTCKFGNPGSPSWQFIIINSDLCGSLQTSLYIPYHRPPFTRRCD